jgi:predicted metal-dependent phosphoesterase TrpH
MRGRFDLHIHTTASDGMLEPEDVVREAARAGLGCIAVTDHDSDRGVRPAQAEGRRLGIPVIAGAEFTAEYPGELHILAYGMALDSGAWKAFSAEQRARRAERNTRMLERIDALGLDIPEALRPWNVPGEYGRMHMALGLVETGCASSVQDAFDRYLGIGAPAYVKRRKFAPAEIIAAVKEAEGFAVLAHPGRMGEPRGKLREIVLELKRDGLEGLEAFYPLHGPEEAAFFRELAESAGLVCTYGSDWHGFDKPGLAQGFDGFDIPESTYDWLEGLISRAGGCV